MVAPRSRRLYALCLCAVLSAACVTLISPEREAELGREAAEQVAQQMGLVEDAAVVAYVSELGRRVARYSPRQDVTYQFQVVDMQEPNAFALPGGYIYVSRGLLALSNDEAQLANVLGHEIAHVAARHAAQRQSRAVGVGLVLLPAAVGGALISSVLGVPGDLVNATVNVPLQMLGVGLIASYSRGQEREADDLGQQMAAKAGIDPKGLTDFMDTLEAYEKLKAGETRRPSFFDSHPTTPERVSSSAARAASLSWTPQPGIAVDRPAFLKRVEGVLVGVNPAEGIFEGQRFLHADLDFSVTFPEGWKTVNARAGVGAFAPGKDGQIVLELQGEGDDPREAANQALAQLGKQIDIEVVESTPLRIGRYSAFRAQLVASRGAGPIDLTWIAKGGKIYRFTAMARADVFEAYRPMLRRVSEDFRTLTAAERGSIRENRLRLATARAGESLARLAERTGNAWSDEETAVVNALAPGAPLERGRLLKVAVPQRYMSKRSP